MYPETVKWVRFSESASMEALTPQNKCLTMLWEQPLDSGQCTDPADTHPWFFPVEPFCVHIYFYLLRHWNLGVFIKHLGLRVSPGIQVIKKKRQQSRMFLQPSLCSEFEYSCHITLNLFGLYTSCALKQQEYRCSIWPFKSLHKSLMSLRLWFILSNFPDDWGWYRVHNFLCS